MIRIVLIRHFQTEGNLKKRYIGITNEPVVKNACDELKNRYPEVESVYCSPLLRCRQTAYMIYPGMEPIEEPLLSECNFGDFENKNYLELRNNPVYQKWIDSGGALRFPNGEDPLNFKARSIRGFYRVINSSIAQKQQSIAIVTHGGTIMSIMEQFTKEKKSFYDWHVENGSGYIFELEEKEWKFLNICLIHSLL